MACPAGDLFQRTAEPKVFQLWQKGIAMFTIGVSRVKVATGRKSQTVAVAPSQGADTDYSWVVRMKPPQRFVDEAALVAKQFASADDLVTFLQTHHGGQVERGPGDGPRSPAARPHDACAEAVPLSIVSPDRTDAWTARAVVLVEHAIDQLVLEFAGLPFLPTSINSGEAESVRSSRSRSG